LLYAIGYNSTGTYPDLYAVDLSNGNIARSIGLSDFVLETRGLTQYVVVDSTSGDVSYF
jgi:hypothetical protein